MKKTLIKPNAGNTMMVVLGVICLLAILGLTGYFWWTSQQKQKTTVPYTPILTPTSSSGQIPATNQGATTTVPTVGTVNSTSDLDTISKGLDSTNLSVGSDVTQ